MLNSTELCKSLGCKDETIENCESRCDRFFAAEVGADAQEKETKRQIMEWLVEKVITADKSLDGTYYDYEISVSSKDIESIKNGGDLC